MITNVTSKDNKNLKDIMYKFKELTLMLINSVENEEYDNLDFLINERQKLIDKMELLDYTKEEFKDTCIELQILPLQQKLTTLINNSKSKIRSELDNMATSKTANRNYNKGFRVDAVFFNKQI
jgi:hypothetical protein